MSEATARRIHESIVFVSFPLKAFVVLGWPLFWCFAAFTRVALDIGTGPNYKYNVLPAIWSTGDSIGALYGVAALGLLGCWVVEAVLPLETEPHRTRIRRFFIGTLAGAVYGIVRMNHVVA